MLIEHIEFAAGLCLANCWLVFGYMLYENYQLDERWARGLILLQTIVTLAITINAIGRLIGNDG